MTASVRQPKEVANRNSMKKVVSAIVALQMVEAETKPLVVDSEKATVLAAVATRPHGSSRYSHTRCS